MRYNLTIMDIVGKKTLDVMRTADWYNAHTLRTISPFLTGDILEAGSGTGTFTDTLSNFGNVTAIDLNKKYIRRNNCNHKVECGYGDLESNKYFFGKKFFNSIVCLNVLEHIRYDEKALDNMYSLLKSKGNLILIVPAHNLLYSKLDKNLGHYRRYNKDNLSKKLIKSGFEPVLVKYFNWLGAIGWLIILKIMNRKYMPGGEVGIFNKIAKYFLWVERFVKIPFGLSVLAIVRKK